ncbi:conserved hypothetical protein [Ricinus communis]|uniref:Uncharacterized protein n=1 Tax=Ricinus communis TaxID=3988 RepID=B9STP3_RICCO|nr:conserved hypothetical protein [Ricinus communis]
MSPLSKVIASWCNKPVVEEEMGNDDDRVYEYAPATSTEGDDDDDDDDDKDCAPAA